MLCAGGERVAQAIGRTAARHSSTARLVAGSAGRAVYRGAPLAPGCVPGCVPGCAPVRAPRRGTAVGGESQIFTAVPMTRCLAVGRGRRRIRRFANWLTLAALASAVGCRAPTVEERQLVEAGRLSISLDGPWQAWLDRGASGLAEGWVADLTAGRRPPGAPPAPVDVTVPGALEVTAATRNYDGVSFWVRDLRAPARLDGCRARLRFGQVNYACRAWLDGEPIGSHEGGYDAFELDVTGRLSGGEHRLVVMVVDPGPVPVLGLTLANTPNGKESWYENTGGLLGPVELVIDRGFVATALAVAPEPATGTVAVRGPLLAPPGAAASVARVVLSVSEAAGDGAAAPAVVARRELDVPVEGDGVARLDATLDVPASARWSPESPHLYRLAVAVDGREIAERTFGFRSLAVEHGDLLVNGERRVLKGVLWQPHFTGTGGVTPPAAVLEQEVRDILDTGFNLVRAHVRPAPPAFLDAADRLGLLVLEEPAIGWVDDDPALPERMAHELAWMVERDGHHPCIILWGVLNELSGKAYRHAAELTARIAALDGSRPVLEDSGGFIGGGRCVPPVAAGSTAASGADVARDAANAARSEPIAELPMIDRHSYPPWPLPTESRDELARLGSPDQLVFVSEYGYGTLLDTVAAATGFRERGVLDSERVRFESFAATARRAATANDGGRRGGWVVEAQQSQADAAEDMTEALRSNPALDLLCWTQWRAVSAESSAGLLEPWGASRPARDRLRHALRPVLAVVLPERPSVAAGEVIRCDVALVNDTGAPIRARGRLDWTWDPEAPEPGASGHDSGALPLGADAEGRMELATGVTRTTLTLPARGRPGILVLQAWLLEDGPSGATLESSTPRAVPVVAPRPPLEPTWIAAPGGLRAAHAVPWPEVWAPPDDAHARDFLARQGQAVTRAEPDGARVALISHPERLARSLPLEGQARLWSMVRAGGSAIVLLPDPGEGELARSLGQRGGMRTLTVLPAPVPVGGAAGHFMGRVHVLREAGAGSLRLLGRGDESFSPRAMVLGPATEGVDDVLVTLGPLGNRLGAPVSVVPFGRGRITLVGLPLLAPVHGAVDPAREARLADLLHEALAAARAAQSAAPPVAPLVALPAGLAQELQTGADILDQLVDLGDSGSPLAGSAPEGRLPDRVAALPGRRTAALEALLEGRPLECREILLAALAPLWTDTTQRVLAEEAAVLAGLGARVAAAGRGDWDAAYEASEAWAHGVSAWFGGDVGGALQALQEARRLLQAGPETTP